MRDVVKYNEYQRAYQQARYVVRREIAVRRLGGVCTDCGSSDSLEFDHIDPSTKLLPIGKLWTASDERFDNELAKCQLLCKSCHIDKTRQERLRSSMVEQTTLNRPMRVRVPTRSPATFV